MRIDFSRLKSKDDQPVKSISLPKTKFQNNFYSISGSKDVSRRLRNLCPCSENALKDIQGALDRYTYSVLTRLNKTVHYQSNSAHVKLLLKLSIKKEARSLNLKYHPRYTSHSNRTYSTNFLLCDKNNNT